jgi:septal ring factor EnvC (AmiA/AmiB activator)
MNFTPTEITLLISAIVALGGFLLQMRTTSFSQIMDVNKSLSKRIEDLEAAATKKDLRIESLEADRDAKEIIIDQMASEIKNLERQNDNYKKWMTKAITEINRTGGTPPEMI